MKIAYLIDRLNPARGGAETYSFDFTEKLAAEGHEVHVFARADSVVPAGVTLHPVPVRGIGRAWRTLSFARNVDRMLSTEKFDVVHGTGWTYSQDVFQPHGGVYMATLAANASALHGWDFFLECLRQAYSVKETVYRRIERTRYRRRPALVFVAVSNMVKRDMEVLNRVPPGKIEVVYNGVDAERFHPRNREIHRSAVRKLHGIGDDEVVFLIVAHNFRLKGVPGLVTCATEKDFPPCRLLVVGRGVSADIRRHAGSRAPGRVIFAGAVSDTVPFYAAADVYAHPTYYDPCSLVVLEALASGLPVVTTVANGAHELMSQGREGRLVVPGDAAGLRETLRGLFEPALREKMGRAARALAEKHTLHHNYLDMMRVYEKAMSLKGKI